MQFVKALVAAAMIVTAVAASPIYTPGSSGIIEKRNTCTDPSYGEWYCPEKCGPRAATCYCGKVLC
ncbi:hypothetical protein BOTBODRAFT_35381 [Botryobasidium botryosum FD-172 SS1]|uniref:Carbohydrate-binding module family 1 protein n=1 Tax=Botryobasidium botryosum (strain FD-172 SS1) TaxID=930990 RepID=A0A067M7H6_BOTB1|nr:hypothetical protein BOTBODRAFT_35381 [Botryobasidium botryosum FD-172 SS1]